MIFLIFFAIIIIIIVVVVIFILIKNNTIDNGLNALNTGQLPARSECTSTSQCQSGLICKNNVCLAPIGESCSLVQDCVMEATACYRCKCIDTPLSGIGGLPPCKDGLVVDSGKCLVPIGGRCTQRSDCVDSAGSCTNGVCIEVMRGLNSRCNAEFPCDPGYICDDHRCKISTLSFIPCCDDSQCEYNSECINSRCNLLSTGRE